MSRNPYASPSFGLWFFHTVANALPSGILARNFGYETPADLVAMAVVVTAFVVFTPLSPLWALYCSRSEWGRSLRISLWIRSVMSLLLVPMMLAGARGFVHAGPAVIELYAGLTVRGVLEAVSRWTSHILPLEGVAHTGLMTLLTGLVLLGAVFIVATVVRGIRALANFVPQEHPPQRSYRPGDY